MKLLLIATFLLVQACQVIAGKTFGYPDVSEPSKEDAKYVDERILPASLLVLTPSSAMADVFRLLPTMDKAGDRGPRGKDYFDTFSKTHFYRTVTVQEDKYGIHNISFDSTFPTPSLEEIEKTAAWLLTVFGEPSVAYTRDLTAKHAGAELLALVWTKDGITVGFSLHFASGVHSSLRICRSTTKAEDVFSRANRTMISSKKADIATAVKLWATSIANLK